MAKYICCDNYTANRLREKGFTNQDFNTLDKMLEFSENGESFELLNRLSGECSDFENFTKTDIFNLFHLSIILPQCLVDVFTSIGYDNF